MNPDKLNFDGWRQRYFEAKAGSEERLEALENMPLTARVREDWQEYFRILTDVRDSKGREQFPVTSEVMRIATNGLIMAPSAAAVRERQKWSYRSRLFRYRILAELGWG